MLIKSLLRNKRMVAAALLAFVVAFVSFAGPVTSARWTGAVEFRNQSGSFALNTRSVNTATPPGIVIIFR